MLQLSISNCQKISIYNFQYLKKICQNSQICQKLQLSKFYNSQLTKILTILFLGSEHTIGGLRYPAELHLVHQGVKDQSKLAVLGVFLKQGQQNLALGPEVNILPKIVECGQKARLESGVKLIDKLPECPSSFARYDGSLTTPPCSENVVWTVFTDPVDITGVQVI